MVTKICEECNHPFNVHPCQSETAHFCSLACHAKHKFTHPRIARTCRICGSIFHALASSAKTYCSRACYYQARSLGYYQKTQKCLQCNLPFNVSGKRRSTKFCSEDCFHAWSKGKIKIWNRGLSNCYSAETLTKIREARMRQHIPTRWTRPEQRFQEMCQKHDLPFKYTGNGSFWIGGLNPDFIDSTGQKRVVEIFSDYWHNPEKRVLKESQTEEGRKRIFSELGWGCIIIWERETKSEDQMLTKLSILLDSSWAA